MKVLCTLLRYLDNETNAKVVQPKDIMEYANEVLQYLMPRAEDLEKDRLDTIGDDDQLEVLPDLNKLEDHQIEVKGFLCLVFLLEFWGFYGFVF